MAPNMKILIFCTVFVFICGPCSPNEIVDELQRCEFGPGFDECFCGALNNILPKLQIGNDELRIPSLEPLSIPDMFFKPTPIGMGWLQATMKWNNILVHNFTKSIFTKVHLDKETSTISFETFSPQIVLSGTYRNNGTILQIPVNGGGAFSLVFDKLVTKFITKFEKVNRDGVIYWNFIKSWGNFYQDKFTLLAENMIDGDKRRSSHIVDMINLNSKEQLKEIEKRFCSFIGEVMTGILNNEFAMLPIHEVFGSY